MKIAFPNEFNYSIIEGFLNILFTFNEKFDAIWKILENRDMLHILMFTIFSLSATLLCWPISNNITKVFSGFKNKISAVY